MEPDKKKILRETQKVSRNIFFPSSTCTVIALGEGKADHNHPFSLSRRSPKGEDGKPFIGIFSAYQPLLGTEPFILDLPDLSDLSDLSALPDLYKFYFFA